MSESGAKSSQPLASKGEKDVSEKRGRGRPRKKPQVCGVPWEEGGGPHWAAQPAAMPSGAGHPQAMGQREPPCPTHTPAASPGQGMGMPTVQPPLPPFGQRLLGAHQQQIPPGGGSSQPPQPCSTPELLLAQGLLLLLPRLQLNLPLQTG